jgi:ferredoxin-NADP reductase
LPANRLAATAASSSYICGPEPMMDAVETALVELGLPGERVDTERFDMV